MKEYPKIILYIAHPHYQRCIRAGLFWVVTIFTLFSTFETSYAQNRPTYGQGGSSSSYPKGSTLPNNDLIELDTTIYEYFLLENIYQKINTRDTSADITFLHRDPIYKNGQEYFNLGNSGSAAAPLLYTPHINTGFHPGYNQYDVYAIKSHNFKFYEQNRPMADLYFSQLANQENITVGAQFSRNFKNGLSLSLNYGRISQQGFYTSQSNRSTNFGFGLRYKSKDSRYNGFLLFFQNANNEFNNGGIQDTADLSTNFPISIPVNLGSAFTRQQEKEISFVQYYKLNKDQKSPWNVYLRNDLTYNPSYYKFSDVSVDDSTDLVFYKELAIDSRGIRRYLDINHFKNAFYINGERTAGIQGRAGLSLDYYRLDNNGINSSRTDATLLFDGSIPILKGLSLQTNAKLGLLRNVGNFDIKGKLDIRISKIASFNGGVRLFSSEQSLNSQVLVLNDSLMFSNAFSKSVGSILFANIDIPSIRFQAGLVQSVVNNPVYWDTLALPTQKIGVLSTTYFRLQQNVKVGKFHLDNQAHLQLFSDKLYPLPTFYSTHQVYYQGTLFKKVMDINIGLDFRLVSEFKGAAYQPVYGSFYQTETSLPFFPATNFYLIAKVSSFRALFIMENFGRYLTKDYNLDAVNYPQAEPKLRFVFNWVLKD